MSKREHYIAVTECSHKRKVNGKWQYKLPNDDIWLSGQQLVPWLKKHGMTQQQYYDLYIEPNATHICPACGKTTPFRRLYDGYMQHCNIDCRASSAVYREHAAKAQRGRHMSVECRIKLSNSRIGRALSNECKQKISKANKGKRRTAEQRKKFSIAERLAYAEGRKHPPQISKNYKYHSGHVNVQYCINHANMLFVRSSYEMQFVKLLELHCITYEYESVRLTYNDEHGSVRTYVVDFYLPTLQLLVEIKAAYAINDIRNLCRFNAARQYCITHNMQFVVLTQHDIFDDDCINNLLIQCTK